MNLALEPGRTPDLTESSRRYAESRSIGQISRALKHRHFLGRIWRSMAGMTLVVTLSLGIGLMLDGIGLPGLLLTALTALLTAALLLVYPRLPVPHRAELTTGSLREVVGRTQLWLESRAATLPPATARRIDHLGVMLDALALELNRIEGPPPAAEEIRQLVGQRLPAAIMPSRGADAESRMLANLDRIGADLAFMTRHLAGGTLDDLVLRARRLGV
jgi:hypothetical protein